ncbi:MAG: DUF2065 family protein [Dokdonella sp.]|uniref:DUF2065 family protein n=1 Tax=Dokdonella sp. TaxID=2291710 RepID=UPI002C4A5E0F|nr:DUF2065 family protein [Dokdonella sp.]HOX71920.1 DUF2065 family protein [Dokdonella sp.]HPN79989.1 DUF2065 family protein [Dokdonella sp.]
MPIELAASLCLVLVVEGLVLFAAPGAWKRMAEKLMQIDERTLRIIGAVMVAIGLIALKLVH